MCIRDRAAIALMSGELMRLDNFRLDIGKLKEKFESTAKYIGIYDKIKSHLASICFDENENSKQLRFDGPMLLGFKQFEATEWVASPMYLLDFASSEKAQMIKDKLPLSCLLYTSNASEWIAQGDKYYNAKNYTSALTYYKQAAEAGNARAATMVGWIY